MKRRSVSRRVLFAAPLVVAPNMLACASAIAATGDFYAFLDTVRREAAAQGIRLSTVRKPCALRGAQYLPHVIELDRHQPEQVLTFAQYLAKTVSAGRIENARRQLADNRILLDSVWRRYNVEPRFIVALWGLESDFGAITGNYLVVSSLATLGFDGRRGPYFRGELISALRIIDQGNVTPGNMTGSWAGAMGPMSIHAVDVSSAMPSTSMAMGGAIFGPTGPTCWLQSPILSPISAGVTARPGGVRCCCRLGSMPAIPGLGLGGQWRSGTGWGCAAPMRSRCQPAKARHPW